MSISLSAFSVSKKLEKELSRISSDELFFKDLDPVPDRTKPILELPSRLKRVYALIRKLERKAKQPHRAAEAKQELGLLSGFAQSLFDAEFREVLGEKRKLAPFVIRRGGFVCRHEHRKGK